MRLVEFVDLNNKYTRRGFLGALGAAAAAGITGLGALGSKYFKSSTQQPQPAATQSAVRQSERDIELGIVSKFKNPRERKLATTALRYNIIGLELAQLLAQAAHETANFTRLEEKGADKYFLQKYWGKKAAEALGNQTAEDAIKYIGRGFIQLTGRDMYEWASDRLKMPQLLTEPDLAAHEDIAALVFIAYWKENVERPLRQLKRTWDNTATVSALINRPSVAKKLSDPTAAPKIQGIKDRHDRFIYYARLLGVDKQIGQKQHDQVDYISSNQNKRDTSRKPSGAVSKNVRTGRRM